MIIENCNFNCKETLMGISINGVCTLLPQKAEFLKCEDIPMIKCPYKMFCNKFIDKEELNKRIIKIQNELNKI